RQLSKRQETVAQVALFEHASVKKGRIPGVQAVHASIAVAVQTATEIAHGDKVKEKNYKQLRNPSKLIPGDEAYEHVSRELAKGTKDNDMNAHLMSFNYGILSSSRNFECALHALDRWNNTAPSKVTDMIMITTLKEQGFNDTDIKELLE